MSLPKNRWALLVGVVCACLLLAAPSSQHEEHMELSFKAVTKKDICHNRQVPIISVSEAKRLIAELKMNPEHCPDSYVQSFYELEPILTETKDELICSEKKFDRIAEYHFRYINPRVETYKLGDDLNRPKTVIKRRPLHEEKFDETVQLDDYKQEILIPISLQQFFKAWALQVSGICKRNFVANIERAMQNFDDHDLSLFDATVSSISKQAAGVKSISGKSGKFGKSGNGNGAPVANHPVTKAPIAMENLEFGNLVYLPKLEGELQEGDAKLREQVSMLDLRDQPELNKFMRACKYRFAPVYDKLVMPIERLAKLGYNYAGRHIDGIRDKLDKDAIVSKWKLVTLLCEATGPFELIESQDESLSMELYDYTPLISSTFGDDMWIKGAEALRKELDSIRAQHSRGLKRLLFKAGVGGRKAVAFMDPHQFAWYRRNQNTLSSALNSVSIASNLASILVTFMAG